MSDVHNGHRSPGRAAPVRSTVLTQVGAVGFQTRKGQPIRGHPVPDCPYRRFCPSTLFNLWLYGDQSIEISHGLRLRAAPLSPFGKHVLSGGAEVSAAEVLVRGRFRPKSNSSAQWKRWRMLMQSTLRGGQWHQATASMGKCRSGSPARRQKSGIRARHQTSST